MERPRSSVRLPVLKGSSDSLYVIIAQTNEGLEAIDLEKYARGEIERVTIPINTLVSPADLRAVLERFGVRTNVSWKNTRPKLRLGPYHRYPRLDLGFPLFDIPAKIQLVIYYEYLN